MKIFMLNSTGNVGKSLLSRELFYPRMDDSKIVEIETVNSGSINFNSLNIDKFKADDDFMDVYMQILEHENIILDVGASNLASFWDKLSGFAGVEDLFDFFVIPTGTRGKLQEDTYKTILFLRSEGIDEDKIKVIFNGVETSVESDFEVLLSVDYNFDTSLYVEKNESLFNDLGFLKQTIADIYKSDINSYKEKIISEKEPSEKLKLVKMDLANRQAMKVKEQMDYVFERLTGVKPSWIGEKETVKKAKKNTKKVEEIEDDEDL